MISLGVRYRTVSRLVPLLALVTGILLLRVEVVLGVLVLLVAAAVTASVLDLERYRRSEAASRRLLATEPEPEPVVLVPVVTETRLRRKLRMQFLLRDAVLGDRSMAWIVPDHERFDPTAPVRVHGRPEPGQAVALTSASGRTALLPLGLLRPVPAASEVSATRTARTVALLGWDGEAELGAPAVARPGTRVTPGQFGGEQTTTGAPGLAAATAASIERTEWVRRRIDSSHLVPVALIAIGLSGGLAPWLPVPLLVAGAIALGRLRSWQIQPVAQELARAFGASRGEASKLAVLFVGLHNAKLPPTN